MIKAVVIRHDQKKAAWGREYAFLGAESRPSATVQGNGRYVALSRRSGQMRRQAALAEVQKLGDRQLTMRSGRLNGRS